MTQLSKGNLRLSGFGCIAEGRLTSKTYPDTNTPTTTYETTASWVHSGALLAGRSAMTNESNPHHYRISLRVRHPNADPQEITQLIGIHPSRFWQAGKPRETPAGVPLQGLKA